LTPRGFKQADLLGKRLEKYNIEKIYSSDMLRAIQTANEINRYLNVEVIAKHDLREIDMGECENGWDNINERLPLVMIKTIKLYKVNFLTRDNLFIIDTIRLIFIQLFCDFGFKKGQNERYAT
jgi:hypothetical protein